MKAEVVYTCAQEIYARVKTQKTGQAKGSAGNRKAEAQAAATAQPKGSGAIARRKRAEKTQPTKKRGRPSKRLVKVGRADKVVARCTAQIATGLC